MDEATAHEQVGNLDEETRILIERFVEIKVDGALKGQRAESARIVRSFITTPPVDDFIAREITQGSNRLIGQIAIAVETNSNGN